MLINGYDDSWKLVKIDGLPSRSVNARTAVTGVCVWGGGGREFKRFREVTILE